MATEKSDFNNQDLGSYPDPLAPFVSQPELSQITTRLSNNKRFYAPASREASKQTARFPGTIVNTTNDDSSRESGFDAHICYNTADLVSLNYARRLHTAIRYAFPHLRVYVMLDNPAGPFPTGSFEVALFTPADFGEFVPWITLWHGPLSVIVHTNTADQGSDIEDRRVVNDHTIRALWLGDKLPLNLEMLGTGPPGGRKGGDGSGAGKRTKVGEHGNVNQLEQARDRELR